MPPRHALLEFAWSAAGLLNPCLELRELLLEAHDVQAYQRVELDSWPLSKSSWTRAPTSRSLRRCAIALIS